jgi:conjugal transfer pilus assembly protein TraU
MNPSIRLVLLVISCWLSFSADGSTCPTGAVNPLTSVNWSCMLPIRIGGTITGGAENSDSDSTSSPVCVCPLSGGGVRFGLNVQMWEPARLIDTVSDPFCLMPLGTKISSNLPGELSGSQNTVGVEASLSAQMHFYQFPALQMLDLFTDIDCIEDQEFDIALMTEFVSSWQNDIMAMIIHPESILFANPVSLLACAADSAAAARGKPINELFWCMGSWNTTVYPLAGTISGSDFVEANIGLAARSIYMMSRLGLMRDTAESGCYYTYNPIWKKENYKIQMLKPVSDSNCIPIGQTGLLWGASKHPPVGNDNFLWMLFRKLQCCMSYNY